MFSNVHAERLMETNVEKCLISSCASYVVREERVAVTTYWFGREHFQKGEANSDAVREGISH